MGSTKGQKDRNEWGENKANNMFCRSGRQVRTYAYLLPTNISAQNHYDAYEKPLGQNTKHTPNTTKKWKIRQTASKDSLTIKQNPVLGPLKGGSPSKAAEERGWLVVVQEHEGRNGGKPYKPNIGSDALSLKANMTKDAISTGLMLPTLPRTRPLV